MARLGLLALVSAPACADDSTQTTDTDGTGDSSGTGMAMTVGMTTAPSMTTAMPTDDTGTTAGTDDTADDTVGADSSSTGGEDSSSTGGEDSSSTGGEDSSSTGDSSSGDSSSSGGEATCGNDMIEGAEECDGTDLGAEDCTTQDFDGGTLACAADCTFDTSGCTTAAGCGNGVLEDGEGCDGVDFGGVTCADFDFVFGELSCDGACAIDSTGCTNTTEVCASPGTAIGPDASSFVESLDTIGTGFVTDIDVYLDALHTYTGDLDIQIRQAGGGPSPYLLQDQCDTSEDVLATFDQDAAAAPDCTVPIAVEGDVLPFDDLDAFVGAPAGATWELVVGDDAGGDGGTLQQWCVAVEASVDDPVVCGDDSANLGEVCDGADLAGQDCASQGFADGTLACAADCGSFDTSGCTDVCGDGELTGNETCEGNEMSQATCEDQGFAGGALGCDPTTCVYDTTECSNTVVAACVSPAAAFGAANTSSTISLTDLGNIADIDVRVDITHTFNGDIVLTLVNDALGISVPLVEGDCSGDDDVFATFNDEAAGAPDCNEPIGIEGNVLPLAALTAFDASAIAGDWRLDVVDTFPSLDDGTLNEWCIYITPQ